MDIICKLLLPLACYFNLFDVYFNLCLLLKQRIASSGYMNVDCLHHCASSCNHALYKKEGESLHGSTMLFSIVLTVWNISTAVNKLVFTLFQGWTEEMESGNFFQTGLRFAALFSKFTWW